MLKTTIHNSDVTIIIIYMPNNTAIIFLKKSTRNPRSHRQKHANTNNRRLNAYN